MTQLPTKIPGGAVIAASRGARDRYFRSTGGDSQGQDPRLEQEQDQDQDQESQIYAQSGKMQDELNEVASSSVVDVHISSAHGESVPPDTSVTCATPASTLAETGFHQSLRKLCKLADTIPRQSLQVFHRHNSATFLFLYCAFG